MIIGIGIDAVEIHRFNEWQAYSQKKLSRIFSPEEIAYCLNIPAKSAERFAVRFAVREAFYKAFSIAYPEHDIPFLTLCRAVEVSFAHKRPFLNVQWNLLKSVPQKTSLSLTHTLTTAISIVAIEKI